jgi:hypothetical protein
LHGDEALLRLTHVLLQCLYVLLLQSELMLVLLDHALVGCVLLA